MFKDRKIRVLVVEDSDVVRMFLAHLLNSDSQLQVTGTARNGTEALQALIHESPDVILMDVEMPEMDGFEATRRIMETRPVPIVICGSSAGRETITMFRLMEVGAVAFVEKPLGKGQRDFETTAAHLLQTVKLMSEVKVVRRWPRRPVVTAPATSTPVVIHTAPKVELVGIGASTGGPPVLQTILTALPKDFPAPLLIVQHIAPGFLEGLAEWLNQTTGLRVHIAAYGVRPLPGHVYLAPDDFHMTVRHGGEIMLSKEQPENNLRPSVARLFNSMAEVCGPNAIGVLLTGMGKDGAAELRQMKDCGAFTIAQNRETSIVHGMPGEAIALGAATCVLPADKIAGALIAHVNRQPLQHRGMS